jgi:hypothetical protein
LLRDEEQHRVGADVDRGDAVHFAGAADGVAGAPVVLVAGEPFAGALLN